MRAALTRALAAVLLAAALPASGPARAQSVSPMEISVRSASDRFMATLEVGNPYAEAKRFEMLVFAEDGSAPPQVWVSAPQFDLAPGARRRIVVSAPFDGSENKRFLICAETIARESGTSRIRGQVCARVSAQRFSPRP